MCLLGSNSLQPMEIQLPLYLNRELHAPYSRRPYWAWFGEGHDWLLVIQGDQFVISDALAGAAYEGVIAVMTYLTIFAFLVQL